MAKYAQDGRLEPACHWSGFGLRTLNARRLLLRALLEESFWECNALSAYPVREHLWNGMVTPYLVIAQGGAL